MRCKCCNGNRFAAQQPVMMGVMVDGNNHFIGHLPGGAETNIRGTGKPFGTYVCIDCGAKYNSLAGYSLPFNMKYGVDGKWRFKDGTEVTICSIAQGAYCEEYDDDGEFGMEVFPCTVDMLSHRVVEIFRTGPSKEHKRRIGRYVTIAGDRGDKITHTVVDAADYTPEMSEAFWTESD